MSDIPIKPNVPTIPVRQSRPIKLKDKAGRSRVTFHLRTFFGFMPETLIIEKVSKENNTIIISAVLTDGELKNENKRSKENRKKGKGVGKGTPEKD